MPSLLNIISTSVIADLIFYYIDDGMGFFALSRTCQDFRNILNASHPSYPWHLDEQLRRHFGVESPQAIRRLQYYYNAVVYGEFSLWFMSGCPRSWRPTEIHIFMSHDGLNYSSCLAAAKQWRYELIRQGFEPFSPNRVREALAIAAPRTELEFASISMDRPALCLTVNTDFDFQT